MIEDGQGRPLSRYEVGLSFVIVVGGAAFGAYAFLRFLWWLA